jgi:hypothetical protein
MTGPKRTDAEPEHLAGTNDASNKLNDSASKTLTSRHD